MEKPQNETLSQCPGSYFYADPAASTVELLKSQTAGAMSMISTPPDRHVFLRHLEQIMGENSKYLAGN